MDTKCQILLLKALQPCTQTQSVFSAGIASFPTLGRVPKKRIQLFFDSSTPEHREVVQAEDPPENGSFGASKLEKCH